MSSTELRMLMQAVLDGEATADEAAELERRLASDDAARGEFEELKRLFDGLAAFPKMHPPEGLYAAIQGALPSARGRTGAGDQLSGVSGVLRPLHGIDLSVDDAVERQHQPQRSFPMSQPHPPYSAKRKAWIGAGIALVAVAIVVRYGFDSVPKSEDVAGTVVPAQRYRAPQGTDEIKLGDQTVAQLMQNDAFVKLIKDPQVQAMAREPGFVAAAQLIRQNPELARMFATNADMAKAMAAPEVARAMEQNAEAMQSVRLAAEAAQRLHASPDAQKVLAGTKEVERYTLWLVEMSKVAPYRAEMDRADAAQLATLNASFAKRFAEHSAAAEKAMKSADLEKAAQSSAEMQKFMNASAEAARNASKYVQAADYLARNQEVAQLSAANVAAAQRLFQSPEAARVMQNPEAMKVLMANPAAAQVLLASPEAARMLQNPEAAKMALTAAAADRNALDKATR